MQLYEGNIGGNSVGGDECGLIWKPLTATETVSVNADLSLLFAWCIKLLKLNTNCLLRTRRWCSCWLCFHYRKPYAVVKPNEGLWSFPWLTTPNDPGNTCFCVLFLQHSQPAGELLFFFFYLYAHCEVKATQAWAPLLRQVENNQESSELALALAVTNAYFGLLAQPQSDRQKAKVTSN